MIPLRSFLILSWILAAANICSSASDEGFQVINKDVKKRCENTNRTGNRQEDPNQGPSGRYDPLECWLWNLKILVPDQIFHESFFSLKIKDLVCTHFEIGSFQSTPNSHSSNPFIDVYVSNVGSECEGKYSTTGFSGKMSAVIRTLPDDPLHLQLTFTSTEATIPDISPSHPIEKATKFHIAKSGNVTNCVANLEVPKGGLKFYGSVSASLINQFAPQIASFISFEASTQLCSAITPSINDMLTTQITNANKYMKKLIAGQINDQGEDDDIANDDDSNNNDENKLITWETGVPILQQGLQLTNEFLANYIHEGIIPLSSSPSKAERPLLQSRKEYSRDLSSFQNRYTLPPNALYPPHPQSLHQCEGILFTGIEGLLKRLTNDTNSVKVTIPKEYSNAHFIIPKYGDIYLNLDSFGLWGINGTESVEILQPFEKRSAKSEIEFSSQMNITLHLNLLVKPIPGGAIQGDPLHEKFDLRIGVSKAQLQMLTEMKVLEQNFDYILAGHIISLISEYVKTTKEHDLKKSSVKDLDWNCIMSSFQSLTFTDMVANMTLNGIRFFNDATRENDKSTLEDELDTLISTILNLMLEEYSVFFRDAVNGLFYGPIRKVLNGFFSDIIHTSGGGTVHNGKMCKAVFPPDNENLIQFDNNHAFEYIESILNQILGTTNVDSVMECMSLYQKLENETWNPLYQKDMDDFSFSLRDIDFTNMNHFQEISVIKPEIDHYHLKNKIDLNTCHDGGRGEISSEACNSTAITFSLVSENENLEIKNAINMTFVVNQLGSQAGLFMKYNLHKLYLVKFSDLMKSLQCGLSPMSELEIYDLISELALDSVHIDMNLTKSKSTLFKYMVLEGKDMNEGLASLLSKGGSMIEDSLNKAFPDYISKASYACNGAIDPPDHQKHYARDVVSILRDILVAIVIFMFLSMFFIQRPKNRDIPVDTEMIEVEQSDESPNDRYDQDMLTFLLLENFDDDQETVELEDINQSQSPESNNDSNFEIEEMARDPLGSSNASLLFNQNISFLVRWSVPICLLSIIFLFISSNTSDGASVEMKLTSASGKSYHLPLPIFKFSLANTIEEMYQAKVYTLMVIVALFSGIWPYVKLLLMLFAWIAPPNTLSTGGRENLLIWLDALGKYSLVDSNILVIMMVAFSLNLDFEDIYSIDVFVIPEYGFYSFLVGTILSLVMGHLILFIHRNVILRHEIRHGGAKEALRNHCFIGLDTLGGLRLTKFLQLFLVTFLVCAIMVLIIGMNIESFYFNIQGATGYMIGDDRVEGFSLISLGNALVQSVENPNNPGIRIIQMTYFFFAAVIPIGSLIVLMILFCRPMTLKDQRQTFMAAEILSAWSATEVFLLSILAALWQLSQFATFIVGDKCNLLNKILKNYFAHELGKDTFCFGIDAKVGWESTYLAVGVFMSTSMTAFLLRIAHQAIEERMQRVGDLEKEHNFDDTIIDRIFKLPFSGFFLLETPNESDIDESTYIYDSQGRRYERDEKKATSFDGLAESLNEPLLSAFNNSF